jgi:hypothetical protein
MLRVADHIEQHPEQYDQSEWMRTDSCGTYGCIAGWTCVLATEQDKQRMADAGLDIRYGYHGIWSTAARAMLGLTKHESWDLFDSDARPPTPDMTVPQWLREFVKVKQSETTAITQESNTDE